MDLRSPPSLLICAICETLNILICVNCTNNTKKSTETEKNINRKIAQKGTKAKRNWQKQTETEQNGHKFTDTERNGQKPSKANGNRQKLTKMGRNELQTKISQKTDRKRKETDRNGQKRMLSFTLKKYIFFGYVEFGLSWLAQFWGQDCHKFQKHNTYGYKFWYKET